jgi:Secretion system C-terminal sorting domain
MNGNGVYVSNDNGTNWTMRFEGFPGTIDILALCIYNNYIFAGAEFSGGVYRRQLSELIGIQPISNEVPNQFLLSQNYPNPFNPVTKIRFALPKSSFAKIVVYDALGGEMETIVNEQLNAGTYEADWSAGRFSSGVYYYKLVVADYTKTKKMVLIK